MNLTGSARNGANATSSFKRRRRPQRHQWCNWTFGGKRKNDRLLSRCSRSVVSSGRLQRRGGAVWAMCETPQADPRQEAPETVAERKRMTPLEMITQIQQQEAEIKGLGLRSECVAPQSFEHRELGFAIGTVLFAILFGPLQSWVGQIAICTNLSFTERSMVSLTRAASASLTIPIRSDSHTFASNLTKGSNTCMISVTTGSMTFV